jgi:acyl dehydratase
VTSAGTSPPSPYTNVDWIEASSRIGEFFDWKGDLAVVMPAAMFPVVADAAIRTIGLSVLPGTLLVAQRLRITRSCQRPPDGPAAPHGSLCARRGGSAGTFFAVRASGSSPIANVETESTFFAPHLTDRVVVGRIAGAPTVRPAADVFWRRRYTIDSSAVGAWCDLVGDHNPIHLDSAFAAACGLPGIPVHGTLLMTQLLVDVLTCVHVEPNDTMACEIRFRRPVLAGSEMLASAAWSAVGDIALTASTEPGEVALRGLFTVG